MDAGDVDRVRRAVHEECGWSADASTVRRFAATRDGDVRVTTELLIEYHRRAPPSQRAPRRLPGTRAPGLSPSRARRRWRQRLDLPVLDAEECREQLTKGGVLRLCASGDSMLHGPTARDVHAHPVIYVVRRPTHPARPTPRAARHVLTKTRSAAAQNPAKSKRVADDRQVERAYTFVIDSVCTEMDANPPIDTFTVLVDLTVRTRPQRPSGAPTGLTRASDPPPWSRSRRARARRLCAAARCAASST